MFNKKDILYSMITGFTAGFLAWRIFSFLNIHNFYFLPAVWLVILIPVFWIFGVNLGYFLGRWFPFFNQFGKFVAIGFTNAAVDFGILNLFIFLTGITAGLWYPVFKIGSFTGGLIHSYIWNKFWAFKAGESGGGKAEFFKFAGVAIVALVINVGVASFIVNFIRPILGIDAKGWANLGAVVGSAIALFFSFAGFRLAVFKGSSQKLES